ncbi:histidine kinase N-terminal 7TM domain-containing protein [Sulfitobacter aestuarii]|uniref:histidine kinase n=1 Tax=Sulfitobacter aestuarii TaxID=2161676 RepID=A0ABW5U106_9RHOB
MLIFWIRAHASLPGAKWFILANYSMLWWLLAVGLELSVPSVECKVFWGQLSWPGIVLLPTFWSFFLYEYALSRNVSTRISLLGVLVFPTLISLLVFSNSWHGLFYGPQTRMITGEQADYVHYDHGPFFFAAIGYLYLLIMGSTLIAGRAAKKANPAVQSFFVKLFLTTVFPVVANLGYVIFGFTLYGMDPTPFSFAISLTLVVWLILDNRWVDVNAIARDLLFYNSSDLVFIVDGQGKLFQANQSAQELLGRQPTEGRDLTALAGFGIAFGRLLREGALPEALEVQNGARHFVARAYRISLGRGQKLLGWAVSFVDVTTQRLAAERAISAERQQTQFLATVSHELRTPLTVINGSMQMLTANREKLPPEQVDRLLDLTTRNAGRLVTLVNDLLDTQKLASSEFRLKLQICDLGVIVSDAVASMETFRPESGISLTCDAPVGELRVLGDCDRLAQVVTNVISNAIKFSEPGGTVAIRARAAGETAIVEIEDKGCGIPAGAEEKVFGRFTQVDGSDAKEVYGSGLGMHISRQIMLRHGGRIGYVSALGVGTTFSIEIPLDARFPATQETPEALGSRVPPVPAAS